MSNNNTGENNFRVDGFYSVSNSIGYEVEMSYSLDALRTRYTNHDGITDVSEWLEIVYEVDEDGELEAIAKGRHDIPLALVMRV